MDTRIYAKIFANRIRALCNEKKISINQLANMAGIRDSTLNNIVNGGSNNPKIMTLHKIALALGMTPAEFLDFTELSNFSFDGNDNDVDS